MTTATKTNLNKAAAEIGTALGDIVGKAAGKAVAKAVNKAMADAKPAKAARAAKPPVAKTAPKTKGTPVKAKTPAAKTKPTKTVEERRPKRSSEEVEQMTERLYAKIAERPGLKMEELTVALGLSTSDLQLPASRLFGKNSRGHKVGEPRIRVEGHKRATRYFPLAASATPAEGTATTAAPPPEGAEDPAPESAPES